MATIRSEPSLPTANRQQRKREDACHPPVLESQYDAMQTGSRCFLFHFIWISLLFIGLFIVQIVIFALMSFALCLLPGGLFIVLHLCGAIRWTVPAHENSDDKGLSSTRLMMISWVGSFVGVIFAFVSFFSADKWDCIRYPDRVRDGQAGFALIFSGPVIAFLGSVLSAAAYRLFLCASTERLSAAPWLYSGNQRIANRSTVASLVAVLLSSLFLCAFFFNWVLVHPGPW